MKKSNEDILKELANKYALVYGEHLNSERENLNEKLLDSCSDLDKKVNRKIRRAKFLTLRYSLPVAAACLLLLLIVPKQVGINSNDTSYVADNNKAYEVIPLSFELPKEFKVSDIYQDKGETMYLLVNDFSDDVIMSIKKIEDNEDYYFGLRRLEFDNLKAYGISTTDYKMVRFEKEDMVYTLTCKYEINTLIDLCENIIS